MGKVNNYFKDCKTLDEAKNLFKKLVFKLHPDTSNYDSQKDFVLMYSQFENFKPCAEYFREGDDNFNAESFYNVVRQFDGLKNVLITFIGSFIWLEDEEEHTGSTKAQKEEIKKILILGYNLPRFAPKRKKWYYSPEGYKQKFKSSKTFDEIKRTWGSKTYQTHEKEQYKQIA